MFLGINQLLPNTKSSSSRNESLDYHPRGAIGLYIAAAYLFSQSGTFSITALEHLDPSAKTIVLFGVMFAAWGKSAQLPMQIWLPNAMEAPTPVSAYLHAASMVKVGVYIFARFCDVCW